jgi:basic amino acid/polyamine antiporter, APA family
MEEEHLVRTLSLLDVVMIGIAAMIGGSMFILIGPAIGLAGPAVMVAFILNAVITIFTAMAYAELGSSIPEVGGGYRWIREGLPRPFPFINGWLGWFAHIVATSLYAISFGTFMGGLLDVFNIGIVYADKLFATVVIIALAYVNYKGVAPTGNVGNMITLTQLIIIAVLISFGFAVMYTDPDWVVNFSDFAPFGVTGILAAMVLTFIAFEGYEVIVQAGEEVRNPKRNIPRAIFISIATVTTIYTLIAFVAISATDVEGPTWIFIGSNGELGLTKAVDTFIPFGAYLILLGGMVSMLAALNASIFSSARVAVAMGRYYNLPHILSKIHAKNKTPYVAIIASASVILFIVYLLPLQEIAIAAGLIFLILFAQVNAAAINIRKVYGNKLAYGFKTPLFPFIPTIGIALNTVLAFYIMVTQPIGLVITLIWIGIGLLMYKVYSFKHEVEYIAPLLASRGDIVRKGFRILVPYMPEDPMRILNYALSIAEGRDAEVNILRVITVPYQIPLSSGVAYVEDAIRSFESTDDILKNKDVVYHYLIRVSHDTTDALLASIEEQKVDMLIHDLDTFIRNRRLQMLLTCDSLAVRVVDEGSVRKILAFYDDEGEHSKLVLKVLDMFRGADKKVVVYLSRLEDIDYINEKDRLQSHGLEVVGSIADKIDRESLVELIIDSANRYEPDLMILPARLLDVSVLNNPFVLRALDSLSYNIIIARHFTLPAINKTKLLLKKILRY